MTEIVFNGANSGAQVAVNYGEINNSQFYWPPERPETPPEPLSTVPFDRDPDFVNHGTLLEQIEIKGSELGSRIALVANRNLPLNTRIAFATNRPRHGFFWILANNAARFEQSIRDIADRVKMYGRRNAQANVFKLFHDWLQDERNGKWIVILDNLDDDQFLHEVPPVQQDIQGKDDSIKPGRSIWEYFPRSLKGNILITSRSRRVVSSIVDDRDIIPVDLMQKDDAVNLFKKKFRAEGNAEDIIDLTKALDFMPLAIVQAASYIKQLAPRISVPEYLMEFRRSDSQKVTLLADMLSLMSFFDRQGIPDTLIRERKPVKLHTGSPVSETIDEATNDSDGESPSESSVVDWTFEDDVLLLRDYSLISIGANNTGFEMHRLVQLATQKWLEGNFPVSSFENWPRCQLLFSHLQCALTQRPHTETSLGEWASLLLEGASFTLSRGNAVESRRMAKMAVQATQTLFGPEDDKTLSSHEILGLAYRNAGEWKKATTLFEQVSDLGRFEKSEKIQVQVLETRKKKLGKHHSDPLISMNNLATTYSCQGRWKDAEILYLQVLEIRKTLLGEDHNLTLTSMSNLALTYWKQGQCQQAEELQKGVLRIITIKLGKDHPQTLTSMNNLVSTYSDQGRWNEAEELELQVLEARKLKLGVDHPETLISMANLASSYSNQGRWEEAEQLQVSLLEVCKSKLGEYYPTTLTTMSNLALSYSEQGLWADAVILQVQEMEACKHTMGNDHPDTLISMGNLANDQNQWDNAETLLRKVAKIRKIKFGKTHVSTQRSVSNLALVYWKTGRWKKAEVLQIEVTETLKMILGESNPLTLMAMANLALIQESSG
ncbi:hypothetical protein N7539_005010 [Penicillium diatomitis]|uniref:TPR-like protein n=1 Tax=Penicillium diatomitis TaxID=2819901 RepID=A0A9W9X666_9EURO|nr:uncharacterized protein N7539_005010 [Penicillium diatomitis]KAJ5485022.1 hypothetical protein N7539_005010 [Penicillium diatomitis]